MATTPVTPLSNGPLTIDAATDHLEKLFSVPEPATPQAPAAAQQAATEEEVPEEAPATESEPEGGEEVVEEPAAEEIPEAPAQTEEFTVKVDGKELKVSREELLNGYQRTTDYTRKTQGVAEDRKTLQAELVAVQQERAFYQQALPKLQELLQGGGEPNWAEEAKVLGPAELALKKLEWRDRQDAIQRTQAEQQQITAKQQAENAVKYREAVVAEGEKLLEAIPEWKDDKKASVEKQALVEFAQGVGYSRQELEQTVDHRAIVILRKAMLYDQLSKKASQLRTVTPTVAAVKPGTGPAPKKTEIDRAKAAFSKDRSVENAAGVFVHLLD